MARPGRPSPARPLLAATLIVKDEAAQLPACLASLAALVDEVVVYDTGSRDGTVAIARAAGARVVQGSWDGDFARARNAALGHTQAQWVLSVDADERVIADVPVLRARLAKGAGADVLTVRVFNLCPEEFGGSYNHPAPRLLRPSSVRWHGAVHEHPVRLDGARARLEPCPPRILRLDHLGYSDPDVVRSKAERNVELARAQLQSLVAEGCDSGRQIARTLLDLGRSLVVAGCRQDAVDTFEALRELAPGTSEAIQATDALVRLLLGFGQDQAALLLAGELRKAGVDERYCDWLCAQALAQLGQPEEAWRLLRGVDELIDSAGRGLDPGSLAETRALVAYLVGETDEALADLAAAMAAHGRIAGRGALLAQMWGDRPHGDLVRLLGRTLIEDHREALVAELAGSGGPGPAVAALMCTTP